MKLTIAKIIVQILHIRNNHWVVISNKHCSGDDLSMYDTIYDDIDSFTMALLSSMFEENVNVSIVPQVLKQQEDVDCGVFSIAIATSLLHDLSPGPYSHYCSPILLVALRTKQCYLSHNPLAK